MNSLNSILIEGVLISKPYSGEKKVTFSIESARSSKVDEEYVKEFCMSEIHVSGSLGQHVVENIGIGNSVRVVGRIANDHGLVVIVAEHIEIRKDKKRGAA